MRHDRDAPERAALLALLRLDRPPTVPTDDPGAWRALVECTPPGLRPYVVWRAERAAGPLDPPTRASVEAIRRAATVAFLRRRTVAREAVVACRDAGIPLIVLKGMAVAHLAYPDPALRPMSDLDLWVATSALGAAADALASRGLTEPAHWRDPAIRPAMRGLESPDAPFPIELHTRPGSLEDVPDMDFDAALTRSVPFAIGDVEARSLGPADLLLHLSLHGARSHGFTIGLGPVVDVALVVQRWRDAWDWPTMTATWERGRILPWMLLTVTLARDLLGAAVPSGVEASRGALPGWDEMYRLASRQLWSWRGPVLGLAARRLLGARSTAERLRYLWHRGVRYYWEGADPRLHRTLVRRVHDAGARLAFDARVKVRRYFLDWRAGRLAPGTLKQQTSDAQDRRRLEQLAIAGGALPPVASMEHETG